MKRPVFITLLALAATLSAGRGDCPLTTFIGNVRFPSAVVKGPNLPIYYKGSHIDMNNGAYELKEELCVQELFILFTLSSITAQAGNKDCCNTIQNLVMPKDAAYACYKISHHFNPLFHFNGQKPLTWTIETATLPAATKGKLIIPDNTLIVLANPTYIEKLEQDDWKSNNSTYRLPKIVFKEKVSESALSAMSNKALLASLDLKAFHRKPTTLQEIRQQRPTVIVSMVTH